MNTASSLSSDFAAGPYVLSHASSLSLSPRLVWPNEAVNFARWLRANLDALGQAVGLDIVALNAKEIKSGRYVDLLARDARDSSPIIVESQLEPADDAHLGQWLTYAAAVDARAVIWIATRFGDRHARTARWLNANGRLRVFAVELNLTQSGVTDIAATFQVIAGPEGREQAAGAMRQVGEFPGAFWATHLHRRPEEAKLSRFVGPRCRWRATLPRGVVIGEFVEEAAVRVFVRGRGGVTMQQVQEMLGPVALELEKRLEAPLRRPGAAVLLESICATAMTNPAHWNDASSWLGDRAQRYDAALRDLFRGLRRKWR